MVCNHGVQSHWVTEENLVKFDYKGKGRFREPERGSAVIWGWQRAVASRRPEGVTRIKGGCLVEKVLWQDSKLLAEDCRANDLAGTEPREVDTVILTLKESSALVCPQSAETRLETRE